MNKIENAVIESTMLGREDHGILTAYITVGGDGWGCGFGGYTFDQYNKATDKRIGSAFGTEFIRRVLDTLEIGSWEKLIGVPVRVETEGLGGRVLRIGHFRKNRWFDPRALADEMFVPE